MDDDQDDPFDGTWVSASIVAMLNELGVPNLNRYFGCMMLAQGSIDDDLRRLLVEEAVSLICLKRSHNRFKTDWCEGRVTTRFEYANLEGLSGIKFECQVDVDDKTTKATYIITSGLLAYFSAADWLRNQEDERPLKTSYFN